jgi:threonine aldolase
MWTAMRSGREETVIELEQRAAALLGKEAGVFVATCTLANLAGVLALSAPGERVAIDERAHIVVNEGGWLTALARLMPVGLDEAAPLMCLENTHTRRGGTVLSVDDTASRAARAARVHLDGARLGNAAVALGVTLAALAAPADTVALSLNKGLCAPVGAVLAGQEHVVARAREHL